MRRGEDPRLLEVERLKVPELAPARSKEIEQLARARFREAGAHEPIATWRGEALANVLVAAVLCACAISYLTWTAQTLSTLRPAPFELTQRAGTR